MKVWPSGLFFMPRQECKYATEHNQEGSLQDKYGYSHVYIQGATPESYLKFKVNHTTKVAEYTKWQVHSPGEFHALLRQALAYLQSTGIEYFEFYIPAWNPEYQTVAHDLGFVACGYFPGWTLSKTPTGEERIDHLVLAWYSPSHAMDLSQCCLTRYGMRVKAVIEAQLADAGLLQR